MKNFFHLRDLEYVQQTNWNWEKYDVYGMYALGGSGCYRGMASFYLLVSGWIIWGCGIISTENSDAEA